MRFTRSATEIVEDAQAVTTFHDNPQFSRWLASLKPRDELIARLALKDDIGDAAALLAWEARVDALIDKLKPDDVELTEILAAADRAYLDLSRAAFQPKA